MPRACTICKSEHRSAIDRALVRRVPYRTVAEEFSLSRGTIQRHLYECLVPHIYRLREKEDERAALDVLKEVQKLFERTNRRLDKAEQDEDWKPFVAYASEARKDLELCGRLLGDIEPPNVNVYIDQRVQVAILDALTPYPEARLAVADALRELEPELGCDGS